MLEFTPNDYLSKALKGKNIFVDNPLMLFVSGTANEPRQCDTSHAEIKNSDYEFKFSVPQLGSSLWRLQL